MCAAVLDPATGLLRYVTAGHPPPLVLRPDDGATYLPGSGGAALGGGRPLSVAEHRLAVDDLLLLYSDGLVQHPRRSPAHSTVELSHLAGEVHEHERRPGAGDSETGGAGPQLVQRVCAGVLDRASRVGFYDDIVLLGAHRTEPASPLELTLAAEPAALGRMRDELGRWLAALGVSRLDETVLQHSVGELVGNAVEHAYAGRAPDDRVGCEVRVEVRHTSTGVVELTVTDRGSWREPVASNARGRGLAMVQGFCDALEVVHSPAGTCVKVRQQPRRSADLLVGAPSEVGPRADVPLELVPRPGELCVSGPLDAAGADRLRHALPLCTQGGTAPCLLDLSETSLLASAGVQAILDLLRINPALRVLAPLGSPAQHVLELVAVPYSTHRASPSSG